MKLKHIIIYSSILFALLGGGGTLYLLDVIDFFSPLWLFGLLALPFCAFLAVKGISGLPPKTNVFSLVLRSIVVILLVMCLADPQIVKDNDALCVLFLFDHSASVPEEYVAEQLKYVNETVKQKGKDDQVGIIIFGDDASVEASPSRELGLTRIHSLIDRTYTDIQGAMELAVGAFPADQRKKIVVMTDGNENRGSLLEAMRFAAGNGVRTDIVPIGYKYEQEVMIDKVHLPDHIKEMETFDLKVHINARKAGPAVLSMYRNGVKVCDEPLNLKAGQNTYGLALRIDEPGFYTYTARISSEEDTIVENNEASGYVYIQGESRILFVAPGELEVRYLMDACREDNLEADMIRPQALPSSLGLLQNYDCVVLANVSADLISENQMKMLQANTRDLGVGLIMIGGENSFGAGGYADTAIEEALPVSMEIKQRKINPKGALVLVLHTCEFPQGNFWAKKISKKAIDAVGPQDEVGVLIYGPGREEWLFPLRPAEDKAFMYRKIDGATPGDMPSFDPTLRLAYKGLMKSDAMVKHIIIISDGDPSAPQPKLIKDLAAAGITISTIGINPHSPRDVDVLKYLAKTTGGRYYFANDPRALPKIFVKEAKVVKRSLIFNKEFQPLLVLSTEVTKGLLPEEVPSLMAYVATTPKPTALVPMQSDTENKDPVLAYWHYGLGRSVAFTSDATSNWGKNWVRWRKYKKLWSQIIRWSARKREKSDLRIHTVMEGSEGRVIIDAVDREGNYINFLTLNGRLVDPNNQGVPLDIRQTAPGRYEASFDAREVGVNIINVGYQDPETGGQGFIAGGVSVPYSPEYRGLRSNRHLLEQAAAVGGSELLRADPATDRVFESDQPPIRSLQPAWEYLAIAALALFFLDVTVRRVIITREDVRLVLATVKEALVFKPRIAGQDKTMAALLTRKKKTFEHTARPVAAAKDFKKALTKSAMDRSDADARVDDMLPGTEPEPPPVARRAAAPKPQQTQTDGQESYTSRLLAAKRRARGESSEKE